VGGGRRIGAAGSRPAALRHQLERNAADHPRGRGRTGRRGHSRPDLLCGNEFDLLALGNHTANVTVGDTTTSNAGAVVLFRRGGDGQWRFETVLLSPVPSGTSEFGSAISISGDTVLVGATNDKVAGEIVGGAYVFQRNGAVWSHAATLRNPDAENARFGWSVALDGNLAIVGCATCLVLPNPEDPSNTGSFFAFERNLGGTANWGLRGEFFGSNPGFIDNFSKSLRLRGTTLMVGASGSQEGSFFCATPAATGTRSPACPPATPPTPCTGSASISWAAGPRSVRTHGRTTAALRRRGGARSLRGTEQSSKPVAASKASSATASMRWIERARTRSLRPEPAGGPQPTCAGARGCLWFRRQQASRSAASQKRAATFIARRFRA
jgi:hypothetical protein